MICAIVFFGAGAGLMSTKDLDIVGIVVIVIGLYLLVVISVFCGVALTACAARALEGQDTTVGEGIAAAREKLDVIVAWAGVQLVIGALISIVQSLLREAGGASSPRSSAGSPTSRGRWRRSSSSPSSRSRDSARVRRSSARAPCCASTGARA